MNIQKKKKNNKINIQYKETKKEEVLENMSNDEKNNNLQFIRIY